ncbi:copper chaperone PCu(A)C [Beijerinckia mobilis]|uniref:copper chaperone PCu(A)C n=1 Tax=Beijerinckia mobilis TaxID=231434 RepID=UPI00068920F5|nr:copper chaperone PCu(A)C [Beijerinckia mobilis]
MFISRTLRKCREPNADVAPVWLRTILASIMGFSLLACVGPSTLQAETMPIKQRTSLRLDHAFVREPPLGAKVAGAYLRIVNEGVSADRLIGLSTPVADQAEIHSMKIENGIMTMRALPEGLLLPPGEVVELKPGGIHIMLGGLHAPLRQGESFTATLRFEKAGDVEVVFPVESLATGKAAGSPAHDQGHRHGQD